MPRPGTGGPMASRTPRPARRQQNSGIPLGETAGRLAGASPGGTKLAIGSPTPCRAERHARREEAGRRAPAGAATGGGWEASSRLEPRREDRSKRGRSERGEIRDLAGHRGALPARVRHGRRHDGRPRQPQPSTATPLPASRPLPSTRTLSRLMATISDQGNPPGRPRARPTPQVTSRQATAATAVPARRRGRRPRRRAVQPRTPPGPGGRHRRPAPHRRAQPRTAEPY